MKLQMLIKDVSVISTDGDMSVEISGISYDSRRVKKGDVFVAMTGYETDGHKFIPDAIEAGAVAVICERELDVGVATVVVPSSREALARMSCEWFGQPAEKMVFIGVTGTNGKTTTTYLIKHLLETCLGAKVGLVGTNKNMIGQQQIETERTTPESFELQKLFAEMLDAGCTHVVMEVSSHALYLHRVDGIKFKLGIFTNLSQDHLDFHKTMEEYLNAKAILFNRCEMGIINLDDPHSQFLIENASCKVYTYSSAGKNEADLVAKNINLKSNRVEFEAVHMDGISRTELHIPGMFNVSNALAAESAALLLGISLKNITDAMKTFEGVKGRMEVVPTGTDYTIIIDYAHTPDALENILKCVRGFAEGRIVAVFGCGGDRDPKKRPIMGSIAEKLADKVIVTSDNPRTEKPEAIIEDILSGMKKKHKVIVDRVEAIHYAMDTAKKDDIILLCGKGHETYQIVGKTKHHMDEREIVLEHLKNSH